LSYSTRESRAGGRPSLFNQERADKILKALKQGMPYKQAAAYGGVSYDTLNRWRKKGENGDSEELSEFCNAMREAEGEAVYKLLSTIKRSAMFKNDWKAAAWILERRHPKEWGRSAVHPEDNTMKSLMEEMNL